MEACLIPPQSTLAYGTRTRLTPSSTDLGYFHSSYGLIENPMWWQSTRTSTGYPPGAVYPQRPAATPNTASITPMMQAIQAFLDSLKCGRLTVLPKLSFSIYPELECSLPRLPPHPYRLRGRSTPSSHLGQLLRERMPTLLRLSPTPTPGGNIFTKATMCLQPKAIKRRTVLNSALSKTPLSFLIRKETSVGFRKPSLWEVN